MKILNFFESRTKGKIANIGIGLGSEQSQNLKVFKTTQYFLRKNSSKIYFFGKPKAISKILTESTTTKFNFELIESSEPEKDIINYLKENTINAVIRGNLSSSKFLMQLKHILNITEINRLALLESFDSKQFFFGPVGIDECNDYQKKINFIENAIILFKSLDVEPRISILSGGRLSDTGRDEYVDKTINIAKKIITHLKDKYPKLNINHDEILIEASLKNNSNLIIAPDGISGNLIYRTLVHLGGGKAYGAIYMGLNSTIIDTSRVGKISEIEGALILSLALVKT
ncbi:MAG: methanogenesis marker protein Mmp4/MtxX [Promethearchaeota archaeon]|jgi:putative methanogen marker protein 4